MSSVFPLINYPFNNSGMVFRDDHGKPEERYKTFHFDELPKDEVPANAEAHSRYGLYGVTSPDGYHWTKHPRPLIRYFSDTFNIANWDPLLKKYVGFFRHHLSGRTISRAETEDYWNWPPPEPLLYSDPLDNPADDYYTSCYTTYPDDPSLRLLFPSIYHRDTDLVDLRMAISRNGHVFQWVSYSPILPVGANGAWDGGSIYANPSLVHLPNGDLALPYEAYNSVHNEAFFKNYYREFDSRCAVGWAVWKDGRLAGIEAEHRGEFTTNALPANGDQILINARTTRAGSVLVELRQGGKPIEGFRFEDSVPFSGDEIWKPIRWKGKESLGELRGKKLEAGFRLHSAKVFGIRYA